MLHDVTVAYFTPGRGTERVVYQVDADGGDDAASKGRLRAAQDGRGFQIVGIVPAGEPAPSAAMEGAEAEPDGEPAPEPKKRGR